ncbi:sialidase family protein [Zavarzinia aquatilis]|uniref:Photosystem II stability/assembly factor-like protein n=1 Tax=Zavarzinia aquatilis TaxID=2211142 RepID=A0A317E1K4_9PROT|nr:photosystem II stability/assembly factor-like protein [Zavarzinia aquatilis]PWR20304.1 photosystem II stability/assembly factor-like protein [Zavarzinia aquatilis]
MKTAQALGLLAILAGVSPAAAGGTGEFSPVLQGTAHEAMFCLAADGDSMLAVGAPNLVFASTDKGATWRPEPAIATDAALFGCRLKHGVGLIVGQRGTTFRAVGGSWSAVKPVTDARLFAVDLNAAGLAVAVGAFGTMLVSTDSGQTWAPVAFDWSATNGEGFQPHLYGVAVAVDGTITVVGEFETVLRSTDRGASWSVVHGGKASLFDVNLSEDGVGYAVGQNGRVLRTTDGGASWRVVPSGTATNLLGVGRSREGSVVVTGLRGMLVGSDAADRFTSVTPGDVATGWYQPVVSLGGGRWLVAGNDGRIVRLSADGQ